MASAPSQQHMEGIWSAPLPQGLILAQWRIQEEAIVTECSQAESRLHSTSCAYDHLSISKADYCLLPVTFQCWQPMPGTHALSFLRTAGALSHLARPSARWPQGPAARPGAALLSALAGVAATLGCSEKTAPSVTCDKLGIFQASR